MSRQFAISPDVHVRDLSSWFLLATKVQKATGEPFVAVLYDDFGKLQTAYAAGEVDLIYANAADTSRLVAEFDFTAVAQPIGISDEATLAVRADHPAAQITDLGRLPRPLRVAGAAAPDVERVCRILLEPADLGPDDIDLRVERNYVLIAKALLTQQVDLGFFPTAAFNDLSNLTRRQLRPLINSKISVIRHMFLAAPAIAGHLPTIQGLLTELSPTSDGALLTELGAPNGWQVPSPDDVDFMIDLLAALSS